MDASPPLHPTDPILYAYGLGKLDEGSAAAVDSHLEGCDACRQRVSELSGDSFVGRLRNAGRRSEPPPPSAARGPSPSAGPKAPVPDRALAGSLPPELAENSKYEILRELGHGGMGVVYLARNTLMDRLEVLKVLNREMLERRGTYDRFLREVRAAARLNHPHVVAAYSADQYGGLLVSAMEYLEGCDLSQYVKAQGPLPVAHACSFAAQAALGLQHAHERGLVHSDIKPHNLILTLQGKRGIIKILDFGLAKATSENPFDGGLTHEGQMLGTPDYIAPEQSLNAQTADIRADIYSLGCTLYYLLTGGPPFRAPSLVEVLQSHHSVDARPLNLVRPEVPVELAAVVGRMMAKERERRYQAPQEVAEALKPFFKARVVGSRSSDGERSQSRQQDVGRTSADVGSSVSAPPGAAPAPRPERNDAEPSNHPASTWQSLIMVREPEHLSDRPAALAKPLQHRPSWVVPALAAGLLLLGFVVAWAAGVFTIKTKEGLLVLEGVPEQAEVLIDGKNVSVRWPDGGGPLKVTVPAGRRGVMVKKDGFRVFGEEVSIATGGEKVLRVRLIPVEPKKVPETNPWPAAVSLAGQSLPVKGRLLAMSRDGRRVFVASDPESLWVVEAPAASKMIEVRGQPKDQGKTPFIWGAEFSPDGKYVAVGVHGYQVRTWEAASGEEACVTSLFPGWSIAYSPDGQRLAVNGRQTKHVFVGDSATGKALAELGPHSAVTRCVAFSPDGKWLASGSGAWPRDEWERQFGTGHDLKVWNLESGIGFDLEGHSMLITCVAFSPDGKRLASASGDKTAKVWDLATKQCLVTFDKHQVGVGSVRFSPDGRLIASAGGETAVRVWDSATGREIAVLAGLQGDPEFVQFSPEGRWIYSGARSRLRAWETPKPMLKSRGASGPPPGRDGPTTVPVELPKSVPNTIGIKLVLIPPGKFLVGSRDSDPDIEPAERPQHPVVITRPFYLGATEVTQGQYRTVVGDNPSHFKGPDDLPVESVSWNDAIGYCNALSRKEGLPEFYRREGENVVVPDWKGLGYRLPTEAEWEYACRAGSTTRYSFGDKPMALDEFAWHIGNSDNQTHRVGLKRPNAFDLYDISGNVRELCWDAMGPYHDEESPVADPVGPPRGGARMGKGGSFWNDHRSDRAAYRFGYAPGQRVKDVGFRIARTAVPEIVNSIGMKLVLIPASEFLMGSPDSDEDAGADEKPRHRVRITRPFYLGATEVTQAQYRAVTGQNPSHFQGSDVLPVECVSWDDATAFCETLTELERGQLGGARYRLPTEAEWEYACRGGSTTRYSFGDDAARLGEFAWYDRNSSKQTHPVGMKRPNAFNLYDLHGNVWEWCQDWRDTGYYARSPSVDPPGPSQTGFRVTRGGCWVNDARSARSAHRWRAEPESRFNTVGFRVAQVPSEP